ncbi:cation diffusion facilitator family transporter [Franzmannia pantelleriensis]|uniref:Cation diffusion facilitator family transporter n=1 Tax=Franzmannia pantelleriensis TaxID=48727 RepID=A0A1G9X8K8_9GAMM|nr:cation diffusion facilitator family transporter [Halomonas pantelleriensis]SDM92663.1 cation diffusion facilitator family transporter [Halomonas pantelleriensis]
MGHAHLPYDRGSQTREAHRITLIGAVIDTVLGVAKVVVGLIVGSAALVADGVHSFSDLVTDGFVLAATHFGRQAPDTNHPYGHGRIETLATLWLGSILIFVAGGIAWASLTRLFDAASIPAPGGWAIALAVVALLAKEWIFRATLRVAKRVKSRLLEANAWHSRSDALSTVVVLVGLIGAQFGAGWLDAVAAAVVALMVGKIGANLLWESSQELVDTALPEDQQRQMRELAEAVPDVYNVHDLRTRTVGGHVLLDVHIVVPPRVTVSEAHEIGNEVSRRLRERFPTLTDVTFHIDPEDDQGKVDPSLMPGMPLREDVEGKLDEVWSALPVWQARVALDLHYLGNRVDISIFVRELPDGQSLDQAADLLRDYARELGWVGRLRVWQGPGKA